MKPNGTYRARDVDSIDARALAAVFAVGSTVVVALDIAKRKMMAAFGDRVGTIHQVVRFDHPTQTGTFVRLLSMLRESGLTVEAVMEPTGTYGDSLRHLLTQSGIPTYRVDTKHVHDLAEVYDGVPSKHDAKDASLIAWLHAHQRSVPWLEQSESRRRMRALVAQRELFDDPLRRLIARLEPFLARHFPEFETFFDLSRRRTAYALLLAYPSPRDLADAPLDALLAKVAAVRRRPADPLVIARLHAAAKHSAGVPMLDDERVFVQELAGEVLRLFARRAEVDRRIEEAASADVAVCALRHPLGVVTAAVVVASLGSPAEYRCAAAFEKAAGLNLREHSSGTQIGAKHISKRGPGKVRKYLFLAAMRLIQDDERVRAWYRRRNAFLADDKAKALIAVVRKLCRALFHVARGDTFDVAKLFDLRRLGLPVEAAPIQQEG